MYVALDDWLRTMADEYLATYVAAGGSAVKLAITMPPLTADHVRQGLESLAERHAMAHYFVDAASTRIHFIDHLFHAVAAHVDWMDLAGTLMRRLLAQDGFVLPAEDGYCDYAAVAALSGTSEAEVRYRVRALLTEHVARDYAMIQEF